MVLEHGSADDADATRYDLAVLGGGAAITAIGEIAPRRDAGDQTTVELLSRDAGIRAPRRRADELGAAATTALLDAPRGQWDALVARTSNAHGRIDVLVDNAGIRHAARIERETAQAFEDVWRVNALGPFLGVRAVLPAMPQGGAIVNTVSTAGLRWRFISAI